MVKLLTKLKYGIDLEGKNIAPIETSSTELNYRFFDVYKHAFKLIKRQDLSQMINIYLYVICDLETKKFFVKFLKN